jgi:hypothetical protein
MPLLAETTPITWICMAVLLVVSGLLLLRTQRYFARQARAGAPSIPTEPQRSTAAERGASSLGDAGRWEVHMHDLARELSGRLDSKMGALEHLIRDADRAATRLEAALRAEASATRPREEGQAGQARGLMPERSDDAVPTAQPGRYDEIYLLSDYGHPAAEIAHRVGLPIGEVELILSLRKQR